MAIDVVIPVYEGLDEVRDCLESVLAARQQTAFECVVIDDGSPNPELKSYLRQLADQGRVILSVNESNLGFVKTANLGLRRSPERDVVLLNSDTVVNGDWLDRLRRAAYSAERIGTVTPFSNNAEICSFPRLCQDNAPVPGRTTAAIDRALARGLAGRQLDLPTAVGFCMYVRRDCLDQVGYFDEDTFELGYGEENDFCLRASARGWRHLLAADCFVYHVGGVSFSERKRRLVERAMAVLDQRYPHYHAEVAAFIEADPPYALRCKGMIELLRDDSRQRVLAISHHMGGGTERHVRELADCSDELATTILLRPFRGEVLRLSLGIDEADPGLNFDWSRPEQRQSLLRLLRYIGVARVHIHHTLGLEAVLDELLAALAAPYDITLHDYYFIDGNPTLTDPRGMFHPERAGRGAGSNAAAAVTGESELESWQGRHQALFDGAARVFAPSTASLALYRRHYTLPAAIVTGHADMDGVDSLPVSPAREPLGSRPLRVLVLGALGVEKGADLLQEVARLARGESPLLEFSLLGYAYKPLAGVTTLGPYRDEQIGALIAEQDPDLIWFPCRWPETYSYTLSAALKAGCPLLVPDIGSFPERVQGRPLTWVCPWDSSAEACLQQLQAIHAQLAALDPGAVSQWQLPVAAPFAYAADYHQPGAVTPAAEAFGLDEVLAHLAGAGEERQQGRRLGLLRLLLRLKQHPLLAWLARLIPYRLQRAIKRRLSSRPLHDIAP